MSQVGKEKQDLIDNVVEKIVAGRPKKWASMDEKFVFYRTGSGGNIILEELPGRVVVVRCQEYFRQSILKYGLSLKDFRGLFTVASSKEVADRVISIAPKLLEFPPAVGELSCPSLVFKRLPFDAPPDGSAPCPLFRELLSRSSSPDTIAAFVGSLFYKESDRQQYLYLYGDGNDGKGSLCRVLWELLGGASTALQPNVNSNRFWNSQIIGKRLGIFSDSDHVWWFTSGEFKSLTGNDPIFIDRKGEAGHTSKHDCKFIVSSNIRPDISGQRADMRRLLYAEMKTIDCDPDPSYQRRLCDESQGILSYCKAVYLELCPNHEQIPVDEASLKLQHEIVDNNEEIYTEMFLRHFKAVPWANQTENWTSAAEVNAVFLNERVKSSQEVKRIKEIWRRVFSVTYGRLRLNNGERLRAYLGMVPKELSVRHLKVVKHFTELELDNCGPGGPTGDNRFEGSVGPDISQ
jgi:hypothetical protein